MSVVESPTRTADQIFAGWLEEFGAAIESRDAARVADTFLDGGYWRDVLSFTWTFRTYTGPGEIETAMAATMDEVGVRAVRPAPDRTSPRLVKRSGAGMIEAYFDFDTAVGRGTGFVRLPLDGMAGADPERPRAWILLTTLHELRGFEERIGERRPSGTEYSHTFGGENWLDKRNVEREYAEHEPEVLIVGGGQAGLILGARLRQMGVDALIVERNPRIGDNWRNRYHSLTLHNENWANHLPYMPFPPTFPTFLPKDKLANWLESYADAMELNTWTGTDFLGAEFDEQTRRWTVRLRRGDGTERTIRTTHLVLATGAVSGVPSRPELPGLDDFAGEVVHSSEFSDGLRYQGKRAIVVGTGNSAHDVAQELYSSGAAEVTMVQRNPTCVVSLDPCGLMVYALYSEGPDVEDIDLITACIPFPVLESTYQFLTRKTCEIDKDLIDGLNAAGFETDFGADNTGFHMKYLRRGGGYYINVGCSELIIDGKIGILQMRDVDQFTDRGLRKLDGSTLEADLVVLATGYENQQAAVRRFLGDEVAEKVGEVWGFDDHGFMRNMWTRTAQQNFWIMGGALNESRLFSRSLALQLKADLEGLLPEVTAP